jgi:hypothetical protein
MKNPNADLRRNYKRALELSIIGALLLCHFAFFAMRNFQVQAETKTTKRAIIEALPPPPTAHPKPPAPPPLPTTRVVPNNDDEIPEEITIASTTEFYLTDFQPPPPPDDHESDFIPYDKAPELIGGLASIARNVHYPEMAREIQLEGHGHRAYLGGQEWLGLEGRNSQVRRFRSLGRGSLGGCTPIAVETGHAARRAGQSLGCDTSEVRFEV